MTYTFDTIPAKLFFKILETEEYNLLSDENLSDENLEEVWDAIKVQDQELNPDPNADRILSIFKKTQSLKSKFRFIKLAVNYLRSKYDYDLIQELKSRGYKFELDKISKATPEVAKKLWNKTLDNIERESMAIETRIERLQNALPKDTEDDISQDKLNKISFDKTVMNYSAFLNMGFINPNEITQSQYRALIASGNEKIKYLEENGRK